ncbi:MAG: dihydrodipicolinate synthase family protein [Lachnospiraceae bacterium]|nr:dihydrodipicolinate synthase family protein [Lachnospiraceae bacterium]
MKKLHGVTVPLVTPFDKEGRLDEDSLKRLTEYLIEKGIQCLYPAGTTGEMMYLTVEERKRIAEIVVKTSGGRAVVYVQTGAWNLEDTITLSRHAAQIGADGIGVVTPVFFKLTEEELLGFYKLVSESVPKDLPIYLYGIPQCAVNDITPTLAEKIAKECPNVIGIKYSYNDMSRIQKFMTLKDGTFSVLCGPDDLFAVTCLAGGDGTVSGNANVIPEHYEAIWKALQEKKPEEAKRLQQRTNVLNEVLSCSQNIARYKAALKNRGIISGDGMRAPLQPLAADAREKMLAMLEKLNYTTVPNK